MKIKGVQPAHIALILKHIKIVFPKAKIYAFGSRVRGAPRKYSDLDLALDNHKVLDLSKLFKLKEALSETNIPIVIDIIDYQSVSPTFKKIIDQQKMLLYEGGIKE
ncbi:MAG: nucleotidyltransferase domain-containing protein [Deltaproteobacteria bacterium]|nr:nucleotidyltransferase domain-containing protein [Deltaproteobacteria bacterium]